MGFGTPVKQHVIRGSDRAFVAKVDLAWIADKVAGEYDGWTPVSIDKSDLLPGERRLRDDLARAFGSRAA